MSTTALNTALLLPGHRKECHRCDGCGKIANSDEGEPWTAWLSLPLGSALAVTMGVVKPIDCPLCEGTGRVVLLWGPDREWTP